MSRRPAPLHHQRQRIAIGVIVIVIGVFALLDNLHLFDSRLVRPLWPLVFVVAGVLKLQQTRHSDAGKVVGAGLIILGAAWTVANYGLMHFSMHQWWPVFLIGAGVYVIARGVQRTRAIEAGDGEPPAVDMFSSRHERLEHTSRVDAAAVFSGSVIRNDAPDFQGGEVTVAMGGLEIDLRQAAMSQPEAVLNVFVMFGGLVLKVPTGWSVVVRGTPILGGTEDKSVPSMGAAHRLVIDGYVIMGGLEIRN